jgi:uncharacterized membrane protein YkvA (DUF1232 family)
MRVVELLRQWAKTLRRELFTVFYAYRDPRTPWYARVLGALVVAYAFSPIDLIPDFIPVIGYLDDLVLVPLGIALVMKMIPREVVDDARRLAEQRVGVPRPRNWVVGGIIIALWAALAAVIAWRVFRRTR